MALQCELVIGVPVGNFKDVEEAFRGMSFLAPGKVDELMKEIRDDEDVSIELPFNLEYKGHKAKQEYDRRIQFRYDGELSEDDISETSDKENVVAYVGVGLTSRYAPALLDIGHEHGKPPVFEIPLEDCQRLLAQVQTVWPAARLMMVDHWY